MRLGHGLLQCILLAAAAGRLLAQAPKPTLSNIESPYPPIQKSVQLGGVVYGAGAVAYGPAKAPLVLSGNGFGDEGTVQFTPFYKNASGVETAGTPVLATVGMWSSSILFLTVPAGATTGQVTVTSEGKTSNALPFVVTAGAYSTKCPAFPSNTELVVTTSSLPNGEAGLAYSATLTASGGHSPYTWSLTGNALPSGLTLSSSTGVISGTPTSGSNPINITVRATDSSAVAADAILSLAIDTSALTSGTIYSYSVPAGGYDHVGNVLGYSDFIMGTWSLGYDHLSRLMSGYQGGAPGVYPDPYENQHLCLDYDSFGNRTQSDLQTTACNPNPTPSVASSTYDLSTANYNSANRVTWLQNVAPSGFSYDASGNVTGDGINYYAYDAEGRLCATETWPYSGDVQAYGYLYDAEGRRVAKETVHPAVYGQAPSCNLSSNGFTLTESYLLGQGGERLTSLAWTGGATGTSSWENTNVYAEGKLIAGYDSTASGNAGQPTVALHFHLSDPLGTRRVQTNASGQAELDCQSLPFGDQLYCYPDPGAPGDDLDEDATGSLTSTHFTCKTRDAETGNDDFGARYYSSSTGRFLSPDWSASPQAVPYADLINPQSLNLYGYVGNNPLSRVDRDGHCCYNFVVGTVGGVLNIVPNTVNLINDVTNAAISPFTSFRFDHVDSIQPDAHASAAGIATGEALQMVAPIGDISEGALVLRNAAQGAAGEAKVGAELVSEGKTIVGSQVGVQTDKGLRVVDHMVQDGGKLSAVEVKTGGATRNASQLAKDASMESNGGKIVGKNAPANLRGQTVKMPTEVRKPQP